MRQRLVAAGLLYLAVAAVGAFVAVTQKLPYHFGGDGDPNNVWGDFVHGSGTAMSPPLGVLALFVVAMAVATRRNWLGRVGIALMVLFGLAFLVGGLGEPLTFDSMNPSNPDPWKAMVQWLGILMSGFVIVFGVLSMFERRNRGEREGRRE